MAKSQPSNGKLLLRVQESERERESSIIESCFSCHTVMVDFMAFHRARTKPQKVKNSEEYIFYDTYFKDFDQY